LTSFSSAKEKNQTNFELFFQLPKKNLLNYSRLFFFVFSCLWPTFGAKGSAQHRPIFFGHA